MVQALAGPEPVLVSVKMSVDEDLQRLDKDVDPRFGKDKKDVVEQILKATTRGEVLPVKGSLMLDFRALCLQVWLTLLLKLFIMFQKNFSFLMVLTSRSCIYTVLISCILMQCKTTVVTSHPMPTQYKQCHENLSVNLHQASKNNCIIYVMQIVMAVWRIFFKF